MHTLTLPPETIERKIYLLRGEKVMFDSDLAQLYRVSTRALNQAVKRNKRRFPGDFMFRLNKKEMLIWKYQFPDSLRSQFVILKNSRGRHKKYLPYVFTEQGVAMLTNHRLLREKIEKLERKYDKQFRIIFEVLKKLLKEEGKPQTSIGFQVERH